MSYTKLKAKVDALSNWDHQTQYLAKSGKLKNKSKKNCCQRIISFFLDSHSKETAIALEVLYKEARNNTFKLHTDMETASELKKLSSKLYSHLVEGQNGEKVKSKKDRRRIAAACQKINCLCKVTLCSSTSSSKDYSSLAVFLKDVQVDQLSTLQVQNYFILVKRYLKAINTPFEKKNPKHCYVANKILIFARQAKKTHLPKGVILTEEQKKLQKHYFEMQSLVLQQIFAKTLSYQAKELTALVECYKLQGQNFEVTQFLNNCIKRHRKGKPYSLPVWYHCTKTDAMPSIIKTKTIFYSSKNVYPGAFVSTQPELSYGPYAFCFSRKINRFAFSANGMIGPLITNYSTNSSDPIYIGKAKPPLRNFNGFFPRSMMWVGFKQSIFFGTQKKSKNPLSYYQEPALSLVAYKSNGLNQKQHLKAQLPRKVQVMEMNDLNVLRDIIKKTVPLHVPLKWGNLIASGGKHLQYSLNVVTNYSS